MKKGFVLEKETIYPDRRRLCNVWNFIIHVPSSFHHTLHDGGSPAYLP